MLTDFNDGNGLIARLREACESFGRDPDAQVTVCAADVLAVLDRNETERVQITDLQIELQNRKDELEACWLTIQEAGL